MDHLEVPEPLSGSGVQRKDAVAEQIGTRAVGPVEIELRAARRHVDDTAAFVDRELAPVVGAAHGLPGVGRPCFVAELAGAWHRVKRPDKRAGEDIERSDVARRRPVLLVGGRIREAAGFRRRARAFRLDVDGQRIAIEASPQIDAAVDAKRKNRFARARVDLLQIVGDAEDEPAILAVLALPVVQAARRRALEALFPPELLAGRCVERHERVVEGAGVDDAIDDERVRAGLAVRVGPGDLELADVGLVDLRGVDESGAVEAAGVVTPVARALTRNRNDYQSQDDNNDCYDERCRSAIAVRLQCAHELTLRFSAFAADANQSQRGTESPRLVLRRSDRKNIERGAGKMTSEELSRRRGVSPDAGLGNRDMVLLADLPRVGALGNRAECTADCVGDRR